MHRFNTVVGKNDPGYMQAAMKVRPVGRHDLEGITKKPETNSQKNTLPEQGVIMKGHAGMTIAA